MVPQSATDDKPARRRTQAAIQQYAEWDDREYTSSTEGWQQRQDAREKARMEMQMESVKRDMLVYKQMVSELKAVLATKKDKKTRKAICMEISANEDIIKITIWNWKLIKRKIEVIAQEEKEPDPKRRKTMRLIVKRVVVVSKIERETAIK